MNFKGQKNFVLSLIICSVLSSSNLAGADERTVNKETIDLPVDEMDWVEEAWGGRTALVWGDPKTGPSTFMIDHPAGFKMPPNMTIAHTANMRGVIITGWMRRQIIIFGVSAALAM